MNLELWFPQPIWFQDHEANFEEAIAFCKKLQSESKGREVSNRGGWQSNDIDIFAHKEFSAVAEILQEKINFLATQLNKEAFSRLTYDNFWVNINKKHDYNAKHFHADCAFSGCIYLKVPENSGNLTFHRPDLQIVFPVPKGLYDPVLFTATSYSPRAGLVVMFPAWLEHEVTMSHADEDRISIAFNIKCERIY